MTKKISTLLALIFLCSDYLYPSVYDNTKFIKTDHFIVRCNSDEMQYAVYIADVAETQFRQIEGFLDYSVTHDINLIVSDDSDFLAGISFSGKLAVSPTSNQILEKTRLYYKLFNLFLRDLACESSSFPALAVGGDPVDEMLCYYSVNGFDAEDELILRDAYLRRYKGMINISSVIKEKREILDAVYSGFFNYIESVYGRKIITRVVKERIHYGNFFRALSAITGKTCSEINSGFNNYLSGKYSAVSPRNNENDFKQSVDAGDSVDFILSPDAGSVFLIKSGNGKSRVEKLDFNSGKTEKIINLADDFTFNSISYADNDRIIIAGTSKENSLVQIYSTDSFIKLNEYKLPGIFIKKISNYLSNNSFIINSDYGVLSGILVADFGNKNISHLPSATLSAVSDSVCFNGKIYYSIKNNLYTVSAADGAKLEPQPLFKIAENISSLAIEGENIVISANSASGGKVYLFSIKNGELSEVLSLDIPLYKTVINGSKLYCLVYHDGGRALLIKSLRR